MQAVSEAFDFWNSHCTRKPVTTVAAVFDRATQEDLRPFTFCEDQFCDPNVLWACSSLDVLPAFDFAQNDITCDVVSVQVVRQCDRPLGSLTKSYADICLANPNGKYTQWSNGTFQDCEDVDTFFPAPVDVTQGLPIQIGGGYRWGTCDEKEETICLFTGLTDRNPRYTNQSGGNSLVCLHAVDSVGKALELLIPSDIVFDDVPVHEAIKTLLSAVGVYVDVSGCDSQCNVSFTAEANDQVKDYLANLIMLDTGRFYADEKGRFKYECESGDQECVYEINTYDHVISTERPSVKDVYNIVKVQQFTNPGGVEETVSDQASVDTFGPSSLTITNPLIDSPQKAQDIGNRLLGLYSQGSFQRTVEIVGIPQLQVGDVICLRERVGSKAGDCTCESVYQTVKYRLCKIIDTYNGEGHSQKLTMDRVGLQD